MEKRHRSRTLTHYLLCLYLTLDHLQQLICISYNILELLAYDVDVFPYIINDTVSMTRHPSMARLRVRLQQATNLPTYYNDSSSSPSPLVC